MAGQGGFTAAPAASAASIKNHKHALSYILDENPLTTNPIQNVSLSQNTHPKFPSSSRKAQATVPFSKEATIEQESLVKVKMEDVEMAGVSGTSGQDSQNGQANLKGRQDQQQAAWEKRHQAILDEDSDDDDPIIRSYDIYIKPKVEKDRQFVVMQFPNRDATQSYNEANGSAPLAIRMKPKAGMFEMDVPVDPWHNYDRLKGVEMGEALNKSESSKGVGTHGLAGGFGIGAQMPNKGGRHKNTKEAEGKTQDALLNDFAGSVQRRQVLTKQTLGGQSVPKDGIRPQYMIGVFRDDQLHLTPVDHLVQMRPQFHHVDAHAESEARNAPRTAPTRPQEARAVHLTAKSNIDGEEDNNDTMAERIAQVQAEAWRTYKVIDENSQQAWDSYDANMFVGHSKGTEELHRDLPKLKSVWNNSEYLEALAPKRTTGKIREKKSKPKAAATVDDPEEFDLSNLEDSD